MQTISCQLRFVTGGQAAYASTLTKTDDAGRYINDVFVPQSLVDLYSLSAGDVVTVRAVPNDPAFAARCPLKAVRVILGDGPPSAVGLASPADTSTSQPYDISKLLHEDASTDAIDLAGVTDGELLEFALDAIDTQALRASDIADLFLDANTSGEDAVAIQRRIFNILTAEGLPHARLYTRAGQQKASELWFARSIRLLRPSTAQGPAPRPA